MCIFMDIIYRLSWKYILMKQWGGYMKAEWIKKVTWMWVYWYAGHVPSLTNTSCLVLLLISPIHTGCLKTPSDGVIWWGQLTTFKDWDVFKRSNYLIRLLILLVWVMFRIVHSISSPATARKKGYVLPLLHRPFRPLNFQALFSSTMGSPDL